MDEYDDTHRWPLNGSTRDTSLVTSGNAVTCASGHSFDVAREGDREICFRPAPHLGHRG